MASEQMTEYERRRLENIKRNSQMIASLKIHSHISDLSTSSKRLREEKSYKSSSEKKSKPENPVVIRRSLRTQGMPPDLSGLPEGFNESPVKPSKSKHSLLPEKSMHREDLHMNITYEGHGSHFALVDKLTRVTRKTNLDVDNGRLNSPTKSERVKLKEIIDPRSLKRKHDGIARKTKLVVDNGHVDSPTEFNSVKLEEPSDPCSLKLEHYNVARKIKSDAENGHTNSPVKFERVKLEEPIDPCSLKLEDDNIARVMPGRILSVRFFPTTEMTMVVAGNKYGHLGFWDVKPQSGEEDVIHLFQPHSAPISGISVHPFGLSKVYSSCYDGLLRMMNIESEKFELVYSSTDEASLYSLTQHPNDVNSLYLGEGPGGLNMFDVRVGKISICWPLHVARINSIDFNPANTNIMATSSTDGYACIWDLRFMNDKKDDKIPQNNSLWTLKHERAVHSAKFSPSGNCLATTSLDDNVGVLCGTNFEYKFMIPHANWTNRWVSSFRAIWGWDDTHLYIGNMKRKVDVLSLTRRKIVHTLESSNMSAIPCRYDAHPYNVGMLAGATSGGQIYIWTAST